MDIDTNCACGAISQFGSPGYIPRCAPASCSVSQFGGVTNGCVHSIARKHTHVDRSKTAAGSRCLDRYEKQTKYTYRRGTLCVSKIWTAIEVVPSTALLTPSYPDTTGLLRRHAPDTCPTNDERASVIKR